ncbi:uncharacterized protein LOC141679536 [Apium graveolens]|uniref:uncharacterized protein LOC141679536 n=1 Tax=Apium graveolens TaxID=4045 RepID=UPI003D7A5957
MKVDPLLDQIKNKNCFGRCIGVMHIIEFQKRGFPHAHMLIWLHPNDRPKTTQQIDKMVSAEIPDPSIDPVGYEAIKNYMIHGPCGTDCENGCTSPITPEKRPLDEIKQYLDGRYVCASEASWRIFGFDIHSRWPSVERLPIHLPNDKHVSFKGSQNLQEVCVNAGTKKSKLEAWFDVNKIYTEAINLTYSEFPSKFTWHPQPGICKQRKRGDVIGRLVEFHSSSGELLYLCMLLLKIKGAVCFDDLKTVNDHVYNSFHDACVALVILQNDQQWHEAIAENAHTSMPPQLRAIFVNILVYSPISHPRSLWESHWGCMSDDIVLVKRHLTENLNLYLSDFEIQNYEIEKLLNDIGKSLRNFPDMPFPGDVFFPTLRID